MYFFIPEFIIINKYFTWAGVQEPNSHTPQTDREINKVHLEDDCRRNLFDNIIYRITENRAYCHAIIKGMVRYFDSSGYVTFVFVLMAAYKIPEPVGKHLQREK